MDIQTSFPPARRSGLIFQVFALVGLVGGAAYVFWQAYQLDVSQGYIFGILTSIALAVPVPFLLYRAYALVQASYALDRDGLRLRWGLRGEDIPLPQIEWVRPADELGFRLPLPFLQWPGAVVGRRKVEGLGEVEFLASDVGRMLLVATPQKIYAISPADNRGFIRSFRQIIELGSLSPLQSYSVQPAAFLATVWRDRWARWTGAAGLGLNLLLYILTALIIPSRAQVSLGYDAARLPLTPWVTSDRLLLLPLLGTVVFVMDLLAGLLFYRQEEQRLVAYLLWSASVLIALLLALAMLLM